MTIPDGQIAESFLRMRTPLARVELAASRMARDANTPAALSLAAGISTAVQEIDQEIVRSLQSLRPPTPAEVDCGDCQELLPALRERTKPVLAAHDIEWTRDASEPERRPVFGDRVSVARGALIMLRAGIALTGPGGGVALELQRHSDEERVGLRLQVQTRPAGDGGGASAPDPLAQPLSFALRSGGSLDIRRRGAHVTATLWLGQTEQG